MEKFYDSFKIFRLKFDNKGDKMMSRRNFLKIAGLSSIALGAGFTAGKLVKSKNQFTLLYMDSFLLMNK